ncbi:TPA: transferrin-binding protein-like solute binding protein [Neisseria meningitidis]
MTPPNHNHHEGSPTGGDTTQPPSAEANASTVNTADTPTTPTPGAGDQDSGGDGGESKTEIPPKDTQGEGENAQAGADGGVQNDAPATGTSNTQPENNRMPGSDAVGSDGSNQDTDAPKNTESQDGTEENVVSEDAGMQASPPSEKNEHTEVAMNAEEGNPPAEAEDSKDAEQADEADGRQDAEGGLQGDDSAAHSPQAQDQTPKNAADNQPKTGVFGEKYFDGTGEITTLMIGEETIDLTVANERLSRNKQLWTDFDKIITSKGFENLIYGAAKLADGSYALFVQGKLSDSLPGGTVTYSGDVLHFRSRNLTEGENWFDAGNSYRTLGSFTATVNFAGKSLTGKINSGDGLYMNTQEFNGSLDGSRFTGTWKNGEKGSISGGFYGVNAAEMAGRYSYVKDVPEKANKYTNNSFGVFGGKKTQ